MKALVHHKLSLQQFFLFQKTVKATLFAVESGVFEQSIAVFVRRTQNMFPRTQAIQLTVSANFPVPLELYTVRHDDLVD